MSLRKYATNLLVRFGMFNCKAAQIPFNANDKLCLDIRAKKTDETYFRSWAIGLMYLTNTQLDIIFFYKSHLLSHA